MAEQRGRVDLEKQRRAIERLRAELGALPGKQPTVTTRAVARIVQDVHLQGRMGNFTVHSDEPAARGGTDLGPSPLQYFMVGVAF
jgi:hypothetical protein